MRTLFLPSALLAGGLLVSGCSDSTTGTDPDLDDQLTADVAVVAADAAYEDVEVLYLHHPALGAPTGNLGRMAGWSAACPFDASTGRFVCVPQARGPLTLNRSYAFADASGAGQTAYDAVTTASANFKSTLAGTVARDLWTATITRGRDFTVTGLAGAEVQHVVNGVGSSAITRSAHGDGGTRSYAISDVATVTDLVAPFPRARGAWPLSGTIRRILTITREANGQSVTRERIATVTFNGTRFAEMVIGDRTFTVDLATGRSGRSRD